MKICTKHEGTEIIVIYDDNIYRKDRNTNLCPLCVAEARLRGYEAAIVKNFGEEND